ncbi:hypothetical protein N8837_01085 [Pseudomonadales bacterium]|nr:hypothetical protein [Pseudomonadales bacterium]
MYLKKTDTKAVLVLKHLEFKFLDALSVSEIDALKEQFVIGYYYGFFTESFPRYAPDFVISLDNVLGDQLKYLYQDIPRFSRSGFNFLPSDLYKHEAKENQYSVYIGDLSPRKNFIEVIRCLNAFEGPVRAYLRITDKLDKFMLPILGSLFCKIANLELIFPAEGANFSRDQILTAIAGSNSVFIPYKREGAARVFAESEVFGKPCIYNENMKGGTLDFIKKDENISLQDYLRGRKVADVTPKSVEQKRKIYCAEHTSILFSAFIKDAFSIDCSFEGDELVNAFSGHKNELPAKFTNEMTDEVPSFSKFTLFLSFHGVPIVSKIRGIRSPYISLNQAKKYILKSLYLVKILISLLRYSYAKD